MICLHNSYSYSVLLISGIELLPPFELLRTDQKRFGYVFICLFPLLRSVVY